MKRAFLLCGSFLLFFTFVFFIGTLSSHAADNQIAGLHYYPGAKEDPASPAISAPHMQNVYLLTSDPFEKVLAWYTRKIGKFKELSSTKGKQATWREEPKEGGFKTVTISTINAPAGQVKITMTKALLTIK